MTKKEETPTVVLFVNCNDTFGYACADAEPLMLEELVDLYKKYKNDSKWGVTKWCCKKRNMRPIGEIREDMKEEGSWEEWMDSLSPNPDEHVYSAR
jgi:hypothetical protein